MMKKMSKGGMKGMAQQLAGLGGGMDGGMPDMKALAGKGAPGGDVCDCGRDYVESDLRAALLPEAT